MRSESNTSTSQHGILSVAQSRPTRALLRSYFSPAPSDVVSPFSACGALTCSIALEYYSSVENVPTEWEVKMICRIICIA